MSKEGIDEELEKATEEWLRKHDPQYSSRWKGYSSIEQMERKSKTEIPLTNLNKKQRKEMNDRFFSTNKGEE